MLLLGIDVGTSSVKVSVVDAELSKAVQTASFPETEAEIISLQKGWAEQSPVQWWYFVKQAIKKCNALGGYNPQDIKAIGIAYQMHGLVCVNEQNESIRNSIIWCDSRAVPIGENAFMHLGYDYCSEHLLNSPGNFTASKLAWVKQHEPELYTRIKTMMLPGDYISLQFTGSVTTTVSALSEGVFWDFKEKSISKPLLDFFGFDQSLFPQVQNVFSIHGVLQKTVAENLQLTAGIPVSYKAGDQPNNALSLNVLNPGEVAATAGTSGVIYGVTDQLMHDEHFRINSFAHVNYTESSNRIGSLLCINGTGILNKWAKHLTGKTSYTQMNAEAATAEPGSNGLCIFPFGNGAERMLCNKIPGAHIAAIDFNRHQHSHILRAVQEGIVFAFRYGLDVMKDNNLLPTVIKAGTANLFLSDVFADCFVNTLNTPLELFACDGSFGAAIGAGIGAGIYADQNEAFAFLEPLKVLEPQKGNVELYESLYQNWNKLLQKQL